MNARSSENILKRHCVCKSFRLTFTAFQKHCQTISSWNVVSLWLLYECVPNYKREKNRVNTLDGKTSSLVKRHLLTTSPNRSTFCGSYDYVIKVLKIVQLRIMTAEIWNWTTTCHHRNQINRDFFCSPSFYLIILNEIRHLC